MNSFEDFKHSVPTIGGRQPTYEQCWLASYPMMSNYHKLPVDAIETRLSAKGIGVADAKTNGLEDKNTAMRELLWA